ncbi:MAG: hypothetical protein KF860_05130 [Cyclobacteriaceae bacterium]|nr:hypothetical protein [Cyclobacteriaceae bacterium]
MFIPFNEISDQAKVWVYQMNREISAPEMEEMATAIETFCSQWQAHGEPLQTSFDIAYNHFLILAVDENASEASGCSVDGSVRVLKELGDRMEIDFFDRGQAAFLINGKIDLYSISKLKELFNAGTLNASMNTFNNLVTTKADYLQNWSVSVAESWLARYLPKSTLA